MLFLLVCLTYAVISPQPSQARLLFPCEPIGGKNFILKLLDSKHECGDGFCSGDDRRFTLAVKSCRKRGSIIRVELNSNGGSVDAGLGIAFELRRLGLHAHVPAGNHCVSSCSLAFLGGVRRTVDPDGTYVVHSFFSEQGMQRSVQQSIDFLNTNFPEFRKQWVIKNPNQKKTMIERLFVDLKPDFVELTRSTVQFSSKVIGFLQQNRLTLKLADSIFNQAVGAIPKQTSSDLSFKCGAPVNDPTGPADFFITGGIHADDAIKFKKALKQCASKQKFINKVVLNSPGGDIDAAFEMTETIKKYSLATSVLKGGRCDRVCGLLFLAGFPRFGKTVKDGVLSGLSQHYYQAGDKFDPKAPPLSRKMAKKILDYVDPIFSKVVTRLKKTNPKRYNQLVADLAQHESKKIIRSQSSGVPFARRLVNLTRASRVSRKFMEHMFATGITGTRTMTPGELKKLAIVTDTNPVKNFIEPQ